MSWRRAGIREPSSGSQRYIAAVTFDAMSIDDLRERIERLLGTDRPAVSGFRDALVDLKVGIKDLTDAIEVTTRELGSEQAELATAERRGKLAQGIGDQETVAIAQTYADRHRERVSVLERKLAVQRDELALAQREYDELAARLRAAKQGIPLEPEPAADRPGDDPLLQAQIDRQAREKAVEAQLELLKKKLGRQ